ncbi:hypothetical protein J7M23_09020 [Candidatus Sumerlaeota bacterium]|nr:hypothetical protein [Candidatus Sumerlaeota bacterium]
MNPHSLNVALTYILSLFYLAFVLTIILGVAEHNSVKKIILSAFRRWLKLVGMLFVLALIVHLVSNL